MIAFLIALSNVTLIGTAPDVAMGTNGSLLASVCAVIASASGVLALGRHREYYRTAIALNIVAALLGAIDLTAAASKYQGHPRLADILVILSTVACGATVPLLLRRLRNTTSRPTSEAG
jgi:integral membrane sensor domain MASE1